MLNLALQTLTLRHKAAMHALRIGRAGLCREFQRCCPHCLTPPSPARHIHTRRRCRCCHRLLLQCVDKSPGEALRSGADSILKELKAMH